ncbi:hypothetical protein JCM10213_002174 [Rhodosporidiobolus nylandii]
MPVYACGANLHGQLPSVDQLQLHAPQLLPNCSSLVAASWSQLVVCDIAGHLQLHGLPLPRDVDLASVACFLGQDSFEAGLLTDGRIERFSYGVRTEERYNLASINGKGEVLVVPVDAPQESHLYPSLSALFEPTTSPLILSLPPSASAESINSLSAGAAHFLVLSSPSESLYAWGDNRYGQCGPVPPTSLAPVAGGGAKAVLPRVEFFDGLFPTSIECGSFHSAVTTRDGSAYVFGSDKDGQLGIGGAGGGSEPALLEVAGEEGGAVKKVAYGAAHTAVLTEQGEVWVAGANHDGQLGLSDFTPRSSFIRLALPPLSPSSSSPTRISRILCTRSTTYIEVP